MNLRATCAVVLLLATGCHRTPASILLFTGKGTSRNDVTAIERVLRDAHLSYTTASSHELSSMAPRRLRTFRLLIVPGGDFEQMGKNLTTTGVANIRDAVHDGLNYVGICAGAFFAGDSPYNGLNLTSGVRFPFYAAEARGIRKTALKISIADAPPLEQFWEDGPQLSGWGNAVAKYDDGTPAIAQGQYGDGAVLLVGVHPEAPESWRAGLRFTTRGDSSRAYAATLIRAGLTGAPLAHY